LARTAIDAATQAGAQYADIRLGDQRAFRCNSGFNGVLTLTYGYGLRVEIDGTTAFIGGTDPTPERLIAAARSAVVTARGLAKTSHIVGGAAHSSDDSNAHRVDRSTSDLFAHVPVVTGEWRAPIAIDPFSVSPDDHMYALAGIGGINDVFRGPVEVSGIDMTWTTETRVFVSSAGSMVTQQLAMACPWFGLMGFSQDPSAVAGETYMPEGLRIFPPATVGFEYVLGMPLRERIHQAMVDLVPWTAYPIGQAEVGRKELVFDGTTFGRVIGETVFPALALNRVLGDEQDVSGTSFLAPPEAVLGQPLFAPSLNVSVVTGGTHFARMQWDDEGSTPRDFPVIARGAVVDYLTDHATLPVMRDWYTKRGQSLQPQGIFRANTADGVPRAAPGACLVESTPNGPASLTELARTMKDGVIVRSGYPLGDQQGAGGWINSANLFEVRKGVITRRLVHGNIEFSTKSLLKGIKTIGGPETMETTTNALTSGVPVTEIPQTVTAPAVYVPNGNLTSTALHLS